MYSKLICIFKKALVSGSQRFDTHTPHNSRKKICNTTVRYPPVIVIRRLSTYKYSDFVIVSYNLFNMSSTDEEQLLLLLALRN